MKVEHPTTDLFGYNFGGTQLLCTSTKFSSTHLENRRVHFRVKKFKKKKKKIWPCKMGLK
jgi:hypothetical protein